MAMNDMSKTNPAVMRTPLGRVRGLGSAKSGTHHWWMQRVTSIALLPLTLWFVVSMLSLAGASFAQTRAFLAWPVNAVLMLALIGLTFHHIAAGLQVVVEDYVRKDMQRIAALLVIKGGCWLMALVCAFAVLRVAFT
jgi:succinate dehydrogenase / fumarate reductase membrane anchor subunit